MNKHYAHIPETEPVMALTYIYNAPRALVWEVFTKPEHLVHWWGPDGFTIEHESSDFRVGGHWKFVMVGPDGTRWQNYHQYTAIDPWIRSVIAMAANLTTRMRLTRSSLSKIMARAPKSP